MIKWTDGTGRTPYTQQVDVLNWIADNINKVDVLAVTAPTAAGKSYICRAIQRHVGADLVTINNALVRQMVKEYPEITPVIGRQHYPSTTAYQDAWLTALTTKEAVIFNSITYAMYCMTRVKDAPPLYKDVVILDEADQHIGLLLEYCKTQIPVKIKDNIKVQGVDAALIALKNRIKEHKKKTTEKAAAIVRKYEFLIKVLLADRPSFAATVNEEEMHVSIVPIRLPKETLRSLFEGKKVILLSGTLMKTDIGDLVGYSKTVATYEMPSPIPVEKRQVHYVPYREGMSYPIDYRKLSDFLKELLTIHTERPAIVHIPYKDAQELRKYFSLDNEEVVWHDKDTKARALALTEVRKGVLIASGMTTGVNLKDDACRLNIITKAMYPNITDMWVQKRRNKPNGEDWYVQQAVKHLVQSAGRSTRNTEDYSKIIITDPRLMGLIASCWKEIPGYFKDSLILGQED